MSRPLWRRFLLGLLALLLAVSAGLFSGWATGRAAPAAAVALSFYDHYCEAAWATYIPSNPHQYLTCPGIAGDKEGFVLAVNPKARLEDGSQAFLSFETVPLFVDNAEIRGSFSLYALGITIQQGDHLLARVGFLDGAEGGNVRFRITYDAVPIEPGGDYELASIEDYYDGQLHDIDVDLSFLAGTSGDLDLVVQGFAWSAGDQAVWVNPRIEHPEPTSTPTIPPTVTSTDTPTVTPTDTPTVTPTDTPTVTPTDTPTIPPTDTPTIPPTSTPTHTPIPTTPVVVISPIPKPTLPPPLVTPEPTPWPESLCACSPVQVTDARFTKYDAFAVGNLVGGPQAELLRVVDEDASGDNGRFYITGDDGTEWSFDKKYTKYDGVAIGNVWPVGQTPAVTGTTPFGQIVVAVDGDKVYIWDAQGNPLNSFPARFTKYDTLAVGNIAGGPEDEIVIAIDEDDKVYLYDGKGNPAGAGEFPIGFDFDGSCPAGDKCDHNDAMAVGNVAGDEREEIVLLDRNDNQSMLYIYDASGVLLMTTAVRFTPYDSLAVGDVLGDEHKEVIIAIDEDRAAYIYDAVLGLEKVVYLARITPADVLAVGDISKGPKDEVLLAIDDDSRVYWIVEQ